jgi:hypothetical protein
MPSWRTLRQHFLPFLSASFFGKLGGGWGKERRDTVMFLTKAGGSSRFIVLIRDEIKNWFG